MARLGWLGPGIVIGGAAIAGVGIWYYIHARPVAGDVIATMDCEGAVLVFRDERGGDRDFVELHDRGEVKWQAFIPHYAGSAGRPAAACSEKSVSVRVERDGRAEVFGFYREDGQKLGGYRLASDHQPIQTQPTGPITLTDHEESYEFVGGPAWHQLIAVGLDSGKGLWKTDLGGDPIDDGGLADGHVWLRQRGTERWFGISDGREIPVTKSGN
ncbi:MAG TPA: hypothetical protein VGF94_22415 [Kofleriaceae bacterium]|jgi:hypothetical protein